jgi:hypothetical protein
MEDSQLVDEVRRHRRWLRIGYSLLAVLFTWIFLLSVGLMLSPRGYAPLAEPGESHSPSHSLSSDMAALSTNMEQANGAVSLGKSSVSRRAEPS